MRPSYVHLNSEDTIVKVGQTFLSARLVILLSESRKRKSTLGGIIRDKRLPPARPDSEEAVSRRLMRWGDVNPSHTLSSTAPSVDKTTGET